METLLMALLFIAIIAGIFFATRKKPGRRHDKRPPGKPKPTSTTGIGPAD